MYLMSLASDSLMMCLFFDLEFDGPLVASGHLHCKHTELELFRCYIEFLWWCQSPAEVNVTEWTDIHEHTTIEHASHFTTAVPHRLNTTSSRLKFLSFIICLLGLSLFFIWSCLIIELRANISTIKKILQAQKYSEFPKVCVWADIK